MRKIGYLKIDYSFIKDGVYEYVIHPESGDIGLINPNIKYMRGAWEAGSSQIKFGYKKGDKGWWATPEYIEIFPLSPALKALYGINPKTKETKE